jgi:hypothetical protein
MSTRWLKIIPVAILACASLVFSQEQGPVTDAHQETNDAKIDGIVVSVDVTAHIVVVRTGEARDTFTVQSGARIMLGMMELSKETTLGDLMPDSRVTLTWKMIDGKRTATRIVQKSEADSKWRNEMP